jgi:hypothetical protein
VFCKLAKVIATGNSKTAYLTVDKSGDHTSSIFLT